MTLLARLLINMLAVLVAAAIVPGIFVSNIFTAFIVAIILGLINITLKPLLIVLTLPINILTLGLFTFVINGFMLLLVSKIVKGFDIVGFMPAFLGALIISVVHFLGQRLAKNNRPNQP